MIPSTPILPHIQPSAGKTRTALVLAGGGLTGAVYEIGALRAIDELLINRDVRDFDIVVGTSAGALVGAMLAKGLTPGEMIQILDGSDPRVRRIQPRHLFSLNLAEFIRRSLRLPSAARNALGHYLRNRSDMNLFDVFWSMIEGMPAGLYDNKALETFVVETLEERYLSNSFDDTRGELYMIATDLDSGERVVFGREPWHEVTLSKAVAASSAVPLLYQPVRIGDHEFVDGGLRGTASLDLAIEAGAKLIVCINPLVPMDNSAKSSAPLTGPEGGFISDKGFQAVGSQILRIVLQSGLDYHVKQLRRRHPDVDIILIEPRRDDYTMFSYNIMRYSACIAIAQHGFESVTVDLASQYPELKAVLARHGLEITRRFVIEELEAIRKSGYDIETVAEMLERCDHRQRAQLDAEQAADAPPPRLHRRQGPAKDFDALRYTLADLERVVRQLEDADAPAA